MREPGFKVAAVAIAIAALWLCPSPGTAADAVAVAETNWEGVTVDIMSVTRKGNVLTVKFAAVNNGDESRKVAFGFTGNNVCYAVDEESGTKYYVLTDEEGNPVASAKDWMPNSTFGINRDIEPGKTLRVWMKLPAPPPEVTTISLFLNETDPLEDVPITDL
jgi:hypothetical protein